ncbi:MAG: V-type ATP synthase subunit D [Deltaproteobacteria bacterium]|nr:V-type ATP synthase subunit D [Deltaproteobacteria bacterium]
MNGARGLAPTRMNLLRARRRLDRVVKGKDLLRRKREALVAELFKLARPAADARTLIAERTRVAYPALLSALAHHGDARLRSMAWPLRELGVEIEPGQVWGVPVSDITGRPPLRRTLAARGTAPGSTGPAAAEAADQFELLADLLLGAAPREMLIRRLAEALGQTSRQVSTLELRVAPELVGQIASLRRTLEEREREEHLRLKHLIKAKKRSGGAGPANTGTGSG